MQISVALAHVQPYSGRLHLNLLAFLHLNFIHIVDFRLENIEALSQQNSALIVDDMIRAQVLRVQASPSVITSQMNPYKAQKTWPPDFSRLNSKHQFRLERKYRRRSKLKFARPHWVKGVKLAQWGVSLSMSLRFACGVIDYNFSRQVSALIASSGWIGARQGRQGHHSLGCVCTCSQQHLENLTLINLRYANGAAGS